MAASRISVEITGSSSELQQAVGRAADALKGLGDVLAKQTDLAVGAGDKTIRVNDLVAKSYQSAAASAGAASEKTIAAFERQGAVSLESAHTQQRAYEETATSAKTSADTQVKASDESAAAGTRAATAHVASAKKTEAAFGSTSSSLSKSGKVISLGLLGAVAASADLAVKFQANTLRMQTQAGATAGQLSKIRKGLLEMAAAVGFTPNQLADGMYHVVSSMNAVIPPAQRVTEELHVMRIAAEGAQVGHANLEDTTYALASALNALHDPGADAKKIMGEINATVGAGDMTMQDYVDALKSGLVPGAKEAGLSLQSLGSALAVMGDMGMRGALAGTRLRMSIALLSSPSAAAAKVLDTLGMSSKEATSTSEAMAKALEKAGLRTTTLGADLKKPDGFMAALSDLNSHLRENGITATGAAAIMNKAFGGGRMGATITLLAENTGRLGLKFDQIGQSASKFGGDFRDVTHTAAFELHSFEAGVVSLATRLGTDLLPDLAQGVHDLSDIVHWFEQGSAAAHSLEIGIGTLATVAIGSYLTSKLISVIKLMREFGTVVNNPLGAMSRFGAATRPGAGGIGGAGGFGTAGGIGIGGARSGYGLPGSVANPVITAMEAGEYAGLGSMGAAGTVSTEEKAAQAEAGAVNAEKSAGGVILPSGVSGGAAAAESEAARVGAGGVLSTVKTGLGSVVSGLMRGGLIAALGITGSQAAGGIIGGKTGKDVSKIGTDASIGAAGGSFFGPEGTLAGGLGGALIGAFQSFFGSGGPSKAQVYAQHFGDDMARYALAGLPKAIQDGSEKGLSATFSDAKLAQEMSSQAAKAAKVPVMTPEGRTGVRETPNIHARQMAGAFSVTGELDNIKAGQQAAEAWIKGYSGVKYKDAGTIVADVQARMGAFPPEARNSAALAVAKYAEGLQANGQLPKGAMAQVLDGMKSNLPGFSQYLSHMGMSTAADFATSMRLSQAQTSLGQALDHIQTDFGNLQGSTKVNGDNMAASFTEATLALKQAADRNVGAAKRDALDQLGQLRDQEVSYLADMSSQTNSYMKTIAGQVKSGSAEAEQSGTLQFGKLQANVAALMSGSSQAVAKGTQIIANALNAGLKAFGEKPLSVPQIQAATPAQLGAVAGGQVSSGALASTHATGGWIGQPGQKGQDSVLAVLGRGEAVLKHQDQAIVNQALAPTPYGSLAGVFSATQGKKHWMDGGGFVGLPMAQGGFTPVIASAEVLGGDGYHGNPIKPDGYSELAVPASVANAGSALGHLPYLTPMRIRAGSREVVAAKQDIGAGSSFNPVMGLYPGTRAQLGLTGGEFHVSIERADGAPLTAAGGAGAAAFKQIAAPKVGGTGTISDIVRGALGLAAKAANAYERAHMPAAAGGAGAPISMLKGGRYVAPPKSASAVVDAMIAEANAISSHNYNYEWGGGHGAIGVPSHGVGHGSGPGIGFDCSGAVSAILHAGGFLSSPLVAADFMSWGDSGPGKFVNIWASPSHTVMSLLGHIFGTSTAENPGGGANWIPTMPESFPSERHPPGYEEGGWAFDPSNLPAADQAKLRSNPYATLPGMGDGGFTSDRVPKAPKPKKGTKEKKPTKGKSTGLTTKDEQDLAELGGKLAKLTADTTRIMGGSGGGSGVFSNLSDRYQAEEGESQYVNPDRSYNAAYYAKHIADDQALLPYLQEALSDYKQELPLVKSGLSKWLGKQSKDNKALRVDTAKIDANKKKLANNKVKEASLRAAILDLGKPTKNQVQAIEDTITKTKLRYDPGVKSAEQAKASYHGKDKATKTRLANAVIAAQRSEANALGPLNEGLVNARIAQQKRAQTLKVKSFDLKQQLSGLTKDDAKIAKDDTSLSQAVTNIKGFLSGASGTLSTNATVNNLETLAENLGNVIWGTGGVFKGVDTTDTGAIFGTNTQIINMQNDIAGTQRDAAAVTSTTTTDDSAFTALMAQYAQQISTGTALQSAEGNVLLGMLPELGATRIPHYAEGGPVLRDGLIYAHQGEHVVPAKGSLVANSAPAQVHIHEHYHGNAAGLQQFVDKRISAPENVKVVSQTIGRRTQLLRR